MTQLYQFKVLRRHGMCDEALGHNYMYKAVVLSEFLYASPVRWGGVETAADEQRIEAFVRREVPYSSVDGGLYQDSDPRKLSTTALTTRDLTLGLLNRLLLNLDL